MTEETRRTVEEILSDPATPKWINDGVAKLRHEQPGYAALLEAIHDYRIGRRA